MRAMYERYPKFVATVAEDHQKGQNEQGHGYLHAQTVAGYAYQIAEDQRVAELAWMAGLMHNTDRLFKDAGDIVIAATLLDYCTNTDLMISSDEEQLVIEAVIEHSKKNNTVDNPVTIALKDADRLANAGTAMLIRIGQFRPDIPVINLKYVFKRDPASTYREPRSQLECMRDILEWESWLRLAKAQELGKQKFAYIRASIENMIDELRSVELLSLSDENNKNVPSAGFATPEYIRSLYADPRN